MKIFVSYRRKDSGDIAGRLYDDLISAYGQESVFKDVDSIPPGDNFRETIARLVEGSTLVLAVIGPNWAGVDESQIRIQRPDDFVRFELAAAKNQGIRVIPLFVNGGRMPPIDTLPGDLKWLPTTNAIPVRHDPDYHNDLNRLKKAIDRFHGIGEEPHSNTSDLPETEGFEESEIQREILLTLADWLVEARRTGKDYRLHLAQIVDALRQKGFSEHLLRIEAEIYALQSQELVMRSSRDEWWLTHEGKSFLVKRGII